jgi:GNAT superfamily N-acetyltransferase/RimJ/RimL family protein N-acetyltransferase
MELAWLDPANPDRRDVDGAVALQEAARAVDTPDYPSPTVSAFLANLRYGWEDNAPDTAVLRDDHGRVVGLLEVWLPKWDNRHLGAVQVTVDPTMRRQGMGEVLGEAGVRHVIGAGRRLLTAFTRDDEAAKGLCEKFGLKQASQEVMRRQDLLQVDWARVDREYANAQQHAMDYELIRFDGRVSDDLMPQVVEMVAAINDAPTDDLDVEDEVFSPERIRAFEDAMLARGQRWRRVAARHKETGQLAGHTNVGVINETPGFAWNGDTSVVRAHRGHRLGLLLKAEMMSWLREDEPQLRWIVTGNAAANKHMIQINELLGYRIMHHEIGWQRALNG